MNKKISDFLSFSAIFLYSILFGGVFVVISYLNKIFQYKSIIHSFALLALLLFFVSAMRIFKKYEDFFIKHRYKLLAAFCLFVFAIQLIINNQMIPSVMYDHEKTFNGAIVWATQGNVPEFEIYNNYLHHYPHQVGLFLIQQFMFKLATTVGYTNYFLVASLGGHILFMIMIITSFKYLDENFGSRPALFFIPLIAIFIPLYFQSSVSYTDTYSVWGASCMLLFGSRAFKEKYTAKKILYAVITGVLAGLAIQIKTTAIIALIAVAIQFFVTDFKKNHFASLAVMLAALLAVNTVFDQWAYATVMEKGREGEAMPTTHWIMMGMQGDGSYSSFDEWSITSAVPADQRVARNIEVIKERLTEMGPVGYVKLLYRKTCRTFGCGNREMYYTYLYSNKSEPVNWVYNLVLQNGRFYTITNNLSHIAYLFTFMLGVVGAVIFMFKKKNKPFAFAPHISLIGFWIFMMLWESNHRQLVNQWSLFFIAGAIGLYRIYSVLFNKE